MAWRPIECPSPALLLLTISETPPQSIILLRLHASAEAAEPSDVERTSRLVHLRKRKSCNKHYVRVIVCSPIEMRKKVISVGILGTGEWTQKVHLPAFKSCGEARLVAI